MVHPFIQFRNIHLRQFRDVLPGNPVAQSLLVQPLAVTFRAGCHADELSGPLLRGSRGFTFLLHRDILCHAFIREEIVGIAQRLIFDAQPLVGPVHDFVERLFGQIFDGRFQRRAIFLADRFDLPKYQGILILAQCHNPAIVNADRRVGNDFRHVQQIHLSQAFALRTSALRRVEGKIVRRRFAVRQSRRRIHQATAIMTHLARIGIQYKHQSVSLLHGDTQTLFQSSFIRCRNDQFVDDHLDAVHLVAVQFHPVHDFPHLTIDPDVQIAFLAHLFKQFLIMTFPVADKRSQQIGFLSLVTLQDQRENLFLRIFDHFLSA